MIDINYCDIFICHTNLNIFTEFISIFAEFLIISLCNVFRCPLPYTNLPSSILQTILYLDNISSRYSGVYSALVWILTPLYLSSLFIFSNSAVIFANNLYRDFSVAFFHTHEYLFAFASNFEPSIYK